MANLSTKPKKRISHKLIFYIALMALPVLQFCIFYIGVNLQSLLLAFQKYDSSASQFFVNWEDLGINFRRIFDYDNNFQNLGILWDCMKNSLVVWLFTSVVGTVGAVLFSYYIFKRKNIGKIFKFVLFIPSILPAVLMSSMFQNFCNEILPFFLNTDKLMSAVETDSKVLFFMTVFYTIWIGFGTQVLLYTGAMEQVSPAVLEAGKLDGVSPMRELWSIILPQVMPTIGTFLVAGVAGIFISQANLYNFFRSSAPEEIQTIGYYMFKLTVPVGAEADYPYLSALGLCCTALAVPPTLLLRKLFKKFED